MFNLRSIRLTAVALVVAAAVLVPQIAGVVAPMQSVQAAVNCNSTLRGGVYPNIPQIGVNELYNCRPEIGDTLNLINNGGPFTLRHDDGVFTNAQRLMPPLGSSAYREYTVVTPGASTRGTRRILTDGDPSRQSYDYNNVYYTDDHYSTVWTVYDDSASSSGMSASAARSAAPSHTRIHVGKR